MVTVLVATKKSLKQGFYKVLDTKVTLLHFFLFSLCSVLFICFTLKHIIVSLFCKVEKFDKRKDLV